MNTSLVNINTNDGSFVAYVAEPIVSNGAALLLLPEIYNINGWIRQVAERYAGIGFHVRVPDLFWRQQANVQLEYNKEDQQAGRLLSGVLNRTTAIADLKFLVDQWHLDLPAGTPIIAVGFCLGGELAYLCAASGFINGASAYYPTHLANNLELGAQINVPTQIHFGELDYRTPEELIQSVRQAVSTQSHVEVYTHKNADHGFNRFGHPPFHAGAAADAQRETLRLIDVVLNK